MEVISTVTMHAIDRFHLLQATKALTESTGIALEGVRGQRHAPAAFYPRKRPGTHCTGGWLGPWAGLDKCGKSRPPAGFDPRTVQPVASRYTD
jgi:hypothetical protein